MSLMRTALLKASQSAWLREHAPRYKFVRATVSRFMPGEQLEDSIRAALSFAGYGMKTIFTHLGENITSAAEAEEVRDHYLSVLDRIRSAGGGRHQAARETSHIADDGLQTRACK